MEKNSLFQIVGEFIDGDFEERNRFWSHRRLIGSIVQTLDSFGELGVFRIPGFGTGLAPPLPPAQIISAKIGRNGKEPGGKLRLDRVAMARLIDTQKGFLGEIECIRLMTNRSLDDRNDR